MVDRGFVGMFVATFFFILVLVHEFSEYPRMKIGDCSGREIYSARLDRVHMQYPASPFSEPTPQMDNVSSEESFSFDPEPEPSKDPS